MQQKLKATLLLMSLTLLACSKSGGSGAGLPESVTPSIDNLEIEMNGIYQAILKPVNAKIAGNYLNGSLNLVREGDEFIADVRLSGGPKSVLHTQSIHIGERCPDERDDLNNDGFIDAEEGIQVYKEILIPLDDDLSSQRIGLGIFPVSDAYGYYFWSRTVSFEKMMNDLFEEDINFADDYVKLNTGKSLLNSGKVVVITGIPSGEFLPDTVQGRGRQSAHEALPIACGVIRKLTSVPGVVDRDYTGIPVPADGETLGGSGGADDGAYFPSQGGTSGGVSGNYGEDDESPETTNNSTEYGSTTGGSPN